MEKATFTGVLLLGPFSVGFGAHASINRQPVGLPESHLACPKCSSKPKQFYRCEKCGTEGTQSQMRKAFNYTPGQPPIVFDQGELRKPAQDKVPCEIQAFVPEDDLDLLQVENCLFLTHDIKFASPDQLQRFATIRDMLVDKKGSLAGLGKMRYEGKERIFAIVPRGRGMLLYIMRFSAQMRDIDDLKKLEAIPEKAPAALLAIAKQIIAQMDDEFDIDECKDLEAERLLALIDARSKSQPLPSAQVAAHAEAETNTFDLLKQALASVEAKKRVPKVKPKVAAPKMVVIKTAKRKVA